jgi:prepilin-type N-terminal cleavage/methylation domain-containing protein
MRVHRRTHGFTLIEIAMVLAIIGAMVLVSAPNFSAWRSSQQVRSGARSVGDALSQARGDAMRSGTTHVVFLRIPGVGTTDPTGTDLVDENLDPVAITVLQDDDDDCYIDAPETRTIYRFEADVAFGSANTLTKAPLDNTPPTSATGATFSDPTAPATPLRWVLFRPDGIPLAFEGDVVAGCGTIGTTGSGSGGIYVTNGDRDFALVMTPLGGIRLHAFNEETNAWTN